MEIYANPRAWRVRVAQAVVWLFGAIIVWLAFGAEPGEESRAERIFVWIIGVMALLVMAATQLYLRVYIIEMRLEGGLRITTLSFFGHRSLTVDPAAVRLGRERHDFSAARMVVNNFWTPLHVPGERLPLIVDTTAASPDFAALERAARRRK